MATKYIVNNVTGQTITGDLTISGNLNTLRTNGLATYSALLTQTGPITGTSINLFNSGLIIGETYTINNYVPSDDFSNIANPINGGVLTFSFYTSASSLEPSDIVYSNVSGITTYGDGEGVTFVITITGGTIADIQIENAGINYIDGNTILISGSTIGGIDITDDITITVNSFTGITNVTGSMFIATGETPSLWLCGTTITSDGGLIVDVLENTLGYDIYWLWAPFGGGGYYVAINDNTGPVSNSFPRNKIQIYTENVLPFYYNAPIAPYLSVSVGSFDNKDDMIFLSVLDFINQLNDNLLYYTPIEIKIKQDTDITPIVIYGEIIPSFPFSYVSIALNCGLTTLDNIYLTATSTTVNNISELVTFLNVDVNSNVLGVYSEGGFGGIILTMPKNNKNKLCMDSTLTFLIFSNV